MMTSFITVLNAQSKKSGYMYAITPPEKGRSDWKEIRRIDLRSGTVESIFQATTQAQLLNARTGKPIKQEPATTSLAPESRQRVYVVENDRTTPRSPKANEQGLKDAEKKVVIIRQRREKADKPFATNSAALAYDKKHERLYYTPMGINQLRYIDLKSKEPKIYYFEDESFGLVKGMSDVGNQITRMVIASDGDGYALTNNARHLIRFTTGKKPKISDLGALTDDPSNGNFSIHRGMGGDLIAGKSGDLYLVTAYKNIWRIDIKSMTATYQGAITGLPEGYQTNGVVVEEGSKLILCSAVSTDGYYRVDLENLIAEKLEGTENSFNASDLANGNLLADKKKKSDEQVAEEEVAKSVEEPSASRSNPLAAETAAGIRVFPNPVTDRLVKVAFDDKPAGKYTVQLLDINGQFISSQSLIVSGKRSVQQLQIPAFISSGTYILKLLSDDKRTNFSTKLTIQ